MQKRNLDLNQYILKKHFKSDLNSKIDKNHLKESSPVKIITKVQKILEEVENELLEKIQKS